MPNPAAPTSSFRSVTAFLLSLMLIGHFLWNVLTPAHYFPPRSEQYTTMLLDLGMFVGLFGFRKTMPAPLFWIALICGLGLLALRLTGDGWYTGHLFYRMGLR